MKLDILGHSELKNIVEEKGKMEKFLLEEKKKNQENYVIECSEEDTKERSYKIKNLLKELPTYEVLYKREVNEITSETCPRCNIDIDWFHVWKCERNEATIEEILYESILNVNTRR
ncbi:hypothetical protein GLOIN_2v1763867 [Rhizophagus irregularis DAOM 181602=DAOM 197198]|uniref:Uncharacterized protein n=1 Tax=Rhizophagus irregularis (strain DAOM 181602 / DAOM 197198 / MUCL 43194) TaxID=747089 RepID=A0A2P4QTF8_RHIID|nr:hypothetical protein GLOIN_2v1763867 [Rhizophagus irregularis DAOM 181602=DAOM 197198]POG80925.1 hypothetical protein GLOIN_2v1763867 [Rhizophagus irregularis DAOM 181602=DAOM 197198]|eukprot:XP_025187791.1 hypothetical protein GLOIN_2v1763867 [Rhizophagus irregularis DAOM 181602=DAOM 197198]